MNRSKQSQGCLFSEDDTSEHNQEKFRTIKDVAELLAVSTRTVRRSIDRKELVAHDIGGSVRIAECDLKSFIAQRRRR
jgi:excisionase family DNA binding protein